MSDPRGQPSGPEGALTAILLTDRANRVPLGARAEKPRDRMRLRALSYGRSCAKARKKLPPSTCLMS
jgi:hypothetical protein